MKNKTLIIEASNIHIGGGYVLLQQLVSQLEEGGQKSLIFLNSCLQGKFSCSANIEIKYIEQSIIGRLKHYVSLPKIPNEGDTLFCFGNIPPFRKLPGYRSIVFIQNWFLVCKISKIKADNLRIYIRLLIERMFLRVFLKNTNLVIVQTNTMKRQVQKINTDSDILVQPFFSVAKIKKYESDDFYFYPARGDNSKNHLNLVKAWIQLSKQGVRPKLIITVDQTVHPKLVVWIEEMNSIYGLEIKNIGFVDISEILNVYCKSPIIIFPSYFESFGMPLIEAEAFDLDIVAPELDYVRDVCSPNETFDPYSPNSIARAVLRHQNLDNEIKCGSAIDIINTLIHGDMPGHEK